MRVSVTGGGGGFQIPDECISSLFRRITLRCNGIPLEDITDVNVKVCAELALTTTQDYIQGANGQ
jgi:hypothetical protein